MTKRNIYMLVMIVILLLLLLYVTCWKGIVDYEYAYPLEPSSDHEAIDAVITWVDSTDQQWIANKKLCEKQQLCDKYKSDNSGVRYTPTDDRIVDAELRLCVELILKHMPQVRNIYIVVARPQKRDWFDNIDKVCVVYHDQIWPSDHGLPTFNSFAIETSIHRIPGLSEKFIYFNDDFYVTAPVHPSQFFDDVGRPIHTAYITHRAQFSFLPNAYCKIWYHLSRRLGYNRLLIPKHVPIALTKTLMRRAELTFGDLWTRTTCAKFRRSDIIPPIGVCVNMNGLVKHPSTYSSSYIDGRRSHIIRSVLTQRKTPNFICVNDCTSDQVCIVYNTMVDFFDLDIPHIK
jgi:hypothetical protein